MHVYFFPPNPAVMKASAYNQNIHARKQPALLSLFWGHPLLNIISVHLMYVFSVSTCWIFSYC